MNTFLHYWGIFLQEYSIIVFTGALVLATLTLARCTATLAREQRRIADLEERPRVIAYLWVATFVDLRLHNVGRNTARDVSVRLLSDEGDAKEYRGSFGERTIVTDKPYPFLPPGEMIIRRFLNPYRRPEKDMDLPPPKIEVRYKSADGEKTYIEHAELDWSVLLGLPIPKDHMGKIADNMYRILRELEKLSRLIQQISNKNR